MMQSKPRQSSSPGKGRKTEHMKKMLEYYQDNPGKVVEEMEQQEDVTQQILLPDTNYSPFFQLPRNYSETLMENEASNVRQSIYHMQLRSQEIQRKSHYQSLHSKKSLIHMNKKHKQIRNNYQKQNVLNKKVIQNHQLEGEIVASTSNFKRDEREGKGRGIFTSGMNRKKYSNQQENKERRTKSSHNMRANLQQQYPEKYEEDRRIVSILKNREVNPTVIYPFENKMKVKRVDDNPKVLGNIIKKKFKHMERHELYNFINQIIKRREK